MILMDTAGKHSYPGKRPHTGPTDSGDSLGIVQLGVLGPAPRAREALGALQRLGKSSRDSPLERDGCWGFSLGAGAGPRAAQPGEAR